MNALATTAPKRSGYLPSLDGWRALAVLAVIMDHDEPWTLFGHTNVAWHEQGGRSVWLFFAISGFLVCTRILEDESLRGRFNIKGFYIRRIFRIQPAMLAYLAAIALLTAFGLLHERWSEILGSALLYKNYLYHSADTSNGWLFTGHYWTLAVEEHFYLLLSFLLFFIHRKRELIFGILIAAVCVWDALALSFTHIYQFPDCLRYTEFNLQFLLCPAFFALLLRRQHIRDLAVKYLHPSVAILGTLLVLVLWSPHERATMPPYPFLVKLFVQHDTDAYWFFQLWVIATVLHPQSWTTRFLELPPLRFLGRLSYSLYLWHVLFMVISRPNSGVTAHWLLAIGERPWRYIATLAAALLSYYFIEKPCIRLGHRLAPPSTPGHRDLDVATAAQT